MAAEDIVEHQFTTENQPKGRRSRKGVPNRATVYKKILASKMKVEMPDGSEKEMTVYEAIALGQTKSAMKGNTKAWQEIQDSIHGKLTDKHEHSGPDGGPIQTQIIIQGAKGSDSPDTHS